MTTNTLKLINLLEGINLYNQAVIQQSSEVKLLVSKLWPHLPETTIVDFRPPNGLWIDIPREMFSTEADRIAQAVQATFVPEMSTDAVRYYSGRNFTLEIGYDFL